MEKCHVTFCRSGLVAVQDYLNILAFVSMLALVFALALFGTCYGGNFVGLLFGCPLIVVMCSPLCCLAIFVATVDSITKATKVVPTAWGLQIHRAFYRRHDVPWSSITVQSQSRRRIKLRLLSRKPRTLVITNEVKAFPELCRLITTQISKGACPPPQAVPIQLPRAKVFAGPIACCLVAATLVVVACSIQNTTPYLNQSTSMPSSVDPAQWRDSLAKEFEENFRDPLESKRNEIHVVVDSQYGAVTYYISIYAPRSDVDGFITCTINLPPSCMFCGPAKSPNIVQTLLPKPDELRVTAYSRARGKPTYLRFVCLGPLPVDLHGVSAWEDIPLPKITQANFQVTEPKVEYPVAVVM